MRQASESTAEGVSLLFLIAEVVFLGLPAQEQGPQTRENVHHGSGSTLDRLLPTLITRDGYVAVEILYEPLVFPYDCPFVRDI